MIYKHITNKYRSPKRYSFCFNTESSAEASAEDSAEDLCKDSFWNVVNEE